jgi:Co/Zn/Cd efflux system component
MADCCEDKACTVDALRERQSSTLKTVLGINAVMFAVELAAGLVAGSTALLSDSLDNLGDALTYGLSLYAVSRGPRSKAKAQSLVATSETLFTPYLRAAPWAFFEMNWYCGLSLTCVTRNPAASIAEV